MTQRSDLQIIVCVAATVKLTAHVHTHTHTHTHTQNVPNVPTGVCARTQLSSPHATALLFNVPMINLLQGSVEVMESLMVASVSSSWRPVSSSSLCFYFMRGAVIYRVSKIVGPLASSASLVPRPCGNAFLLNCDLLIPVLSWSLPSLPHAIPSLTFHTAKWMKCSVLFCYVHMLLIYPSI